MYSIWSCSTPTDFASNNFLDDIVSTTTLSPVEFEKNIKEAEIKLPPKHLKLLFGADAEKRITARLFQYNSNQEEESKLETTTFSYYDFPPEEEAKLLRVVNPNTTHLTVAINNYDDCLLLKTVRRLLLKLLANSLLSVQLYINFSHSEEFSISTVHQVTVFSLLESFNRLSKLEHLTVVIDHPIFGALKSLNSAGNPNFSCDLSFFAHLSELFFSTAEDLQWTPLLHWLAMSVEHGHCSLTKVGLGNPDHHFLLASYAIRHPVLGSTIVEQPNVFWCLPAPFVSQSLELMPQLAHLNLKILSTPDFFSMLLCTRSLVNLQSMVIVFNTASLYTGHRPLYQFEFDSSVLPRFPVLRQLKLVAYVHSHADLLSSLWPTIFPALELLELHHNCVSCHICPRTTSGGLSQSDMKKVKKIMEVCLLRTFKQCPRLGFISANKDGRWSQNYVVTQVNQKKMLLKLHH